MAGARLLAADLSGADLRTVGNSDLALAFNIEIPWNGMFPLERREKSADPPAPGYQVAVNLPLPLARKWWDVEERHRRPLTAPGVIQANLQQAPFIARWDGSGVVLAAQAHPVFLARLAQDIVYPVRRASTKLVDLSARPIRDLITALRGEMLEGCAMGRIFGESIAMALALYLLRIYSVPSLPETSEFRGLPPRRLQAVLDYIEEHLGNDASLAELARLTQLSPDHFAHMFKQSTGVSPHQYFLRRRVAEAKKLLTDRQLSLVEISATLGFASQPHFTTVFRKLVGVTPGTYRKMMR
jgi:AraC family transcriptional regulator